MSAKQVCHDCKECARGEKLLISPSWNPYDMTSEEVLNLHGPCREIFLCNACLEDDEPSSKDDTKFNEEWRREEAMQAGMMGGCEAYNEALGY